MLERIIERVTSNYPIEKLMPLCAAARLDDRPAAINMRAMDWENRPNTFLHCLYKQKRYDGDRACYYIYREDGKIVAGHGYYQFDEDPDMYVQSRVYSIPSHVKKLNTKQTTSNMLGSFLADKAFTQGYLGGIISLEKYNEQLADKIVRITQPHRYPNYYFETDILNDKVVIARHYKDSGLRTQPMKKYEHSCMIKNVEQIILYHLFDQDHKDELYKNLDKVKI